MHLEVALAMWQLLVPAARWQHIGAWCDFLQVNTNVPGGRGGYFSM